MEIRKIPCKTLYLKWNKSRSLDDNDCWFNFNYHKSRPVKTIYDNVYKFKNYRELILTDTEINILKNEFLLNCKDKQNISYRNFIKSFIGHSVLGFEYGIISDYSTWNHFKANYVPKNTFQSETLEFLAEPPFYYFDLEDGEEIQHNKNELEKIKAKNNQEADIKVIENILMPSLNSILEKYGLKYNASGIRFKDYKAYTTLIKKFFDDTIIKELKENGFDVKLNSKIRSFKYDTYLIRKNDIKLKLNNNKELT